MQKKTPKKREQRERESSLLHLSFMCPLNYERILKMRELWKKSGKCKLEHATINCMLKSDKSPNTDPCFIKQGSRKCQL